MENLATSYQTATRKYVEELFKQSLPTEAVYHNLDHTKNVVAAAQEIAQASNIPAQDYEKLMVAAWFHDTGYTNAPKNHEKTSCQIARQFLESQQAPESFIAEVEQIIMATRMPQSPNSFLGQIMCDADLYHLSQEDHVEKSEHLRKEWELMNHQFFTDEEWLANSIDFMRNHSYFTPYMQEQRAPLKKKNIKALKKTLKKLRKNRDEALLNNMEMSQAELKKVQKKLAKASGTPERGIETMFRITSRNHVSFSSIADGKANILISVNSIIISLLIGVLMRKLDTNPHLVIPTIILLVVNLASIVFAILATRPKVTSGLISRVDIENKEGNLLFFGNFHKMEQKDFEWGMWQMLKDREYLYGSMIRDIFFLGVVLGKKYRLLRIAYTIFMFGIILASVAFMISSLYLAPNAPSAMPTDLFE